MLIKHLEINNLRNISSAEISPHPRLNCFIGDNGAGKTTIFEALVVLSKGRSFRSGQAPSLIGSDGTVFRLFSRIESSAGTEHKIGLERDRESWAARHNGENVTQLSELARILPHVLLEPGSHRLVSGPPDGRRRYLDWGVFHVKHDYLGLWRRYSRALKQRNAALRAREAAVVASLDPLLVSLGESLHVLRQQQCERLSQLLRQQLPVFDATLSGIEMIYRKGWSGEGLAEALQASLQTDTERGQTGPGPHRADLHLVLDGEPARERLSRGEQKSLTAALIMAQARLMQDSGEEPVLLLDDLASELDERHVGKVLDAGTQLGAQVWLCGTMLSPVIPSRFKDFALFHVKQGRVEPKSLNFFKNA